MRLGQASFSDQIFPQPLTYCGIALRPWNQTVEIYNPENYANCNYTSSKRRENDR